MPCVCTGMYAVTVDCLATVFTCSVCYNFLLFFLLLVLPLFSSSLPFPLVYLFLLLSLPLICSLPLSFSPSLCLFLLFPPPSSSSGLSSRTSSTWGRGSSSYLSPLRPLSLESRMSSSRVNRTLDTGVHAHNELSFVYVDSYYCVGA